jgi:protein-tyrosine phosphatase
VRCQAGINRSGLVVALILMREGMSTEDAIALIRKRRSKYALDNAHFVEYLKRKI